MLWLALFACAEPVTEVKMTGQVLAGLDSTLGAAEVDVIIRDGDTNDYSSATTDADGIFTVTVPASAAIHIELDGADYVPTAFSAATGPTDFDVPVGALWLRTPQEIEALQATFENCDSVEDEGGVIEGEVHFNAVSEASQSNLIAEEAVVTIYEANGTTHTACYLDSDGYSDPDADQVGATGRFVAFGIPAGPITVGFSYSIDTLKHESFGYVFLPEGGVGPFYPALIEFK